MMTTIYNIPTPWDRDSRIEVYGEPGMACYEWRIVGLENARVIHDSKNAGYGNAEIALRDALNYATQEFES